ncbi:restriction endonuclease subunit M [Candidatus Woesebacteria bacterium]|nr:restriction endonuclease subunit M [Candidatus Woesebacteria bacterium]
MVAQRSDIDIRESALLRRGTLLDILLIDRTTQKNIIWATDSYERCGKVFSPKKNIQTELVTGIYGNLIKPRAAKGLEEQRQRTKDKAEVFTPLETVDKINKAVEVGRPNKSNWQEYVRELKLEITCGEAPFIVSRYNPTAHGVLIKIHNRVGFLDKKLKIVSKFCHQEDEWILWAKESFKASYGYDWQGDNILLARENLLYTMIDYYEAKFKRQPNIKIQEEFAEIISWNIFQMDGLKYVVPMSCHHEDKVIPSVLTLFEEIPATVEKHECAGCKYNRPHKHNGLYVKIMDWEKNKVIRFIDLINF